MDAVDSELFQWVLKSVGVVIGVLASAVALLWKSLESSNARSIKSLETRADECDQDREVLRDRVGELERRLINRVD